MPKNTPAEEPVVVMVRALQDIVTRHFAFDEYAQGSDGVTESAMSTPPTLGVPVGGEQGDRVPAREALDPDESVVRLDGFDSKQRHVHTRMRRAVSHA